LATRKSDQGSSRRPAQGRAVSQLCKRYLILQLLFHPNACSPAKIEVSITSSSPQNPEGSLGAAGVAGAADSGSDD
jgi:hypothetical protein